jgi:hypothetical protein
VLITSSFGFVIGGRSVSRLSATSPLQMDFKVSYSSDFGVGVVARCAALRVPVSDASLCCVHGVALRGAAFQ